MENLEKIIFVLDDSICCGNKLNWVKLDYDEEHAYKLSICKTCQINYQTKDEQQIFFSEPHQNSYRCGKCNSDAKVGEVNYKYFIKIDGEIRGPDEYSDISLRCSKDECEWGLNQKIID